MPAAAGTATAALTPGTTSTATPARLLAPAVIVIGEAVAFRSLLARSLLDAGAIGHR
jgi:hypothetical protein